MKALLHTFWSQSAKDKRISREKIVSVFFSLLLPLKLLTTLIDHENTHIETVNYWQKDLRGKNIYLTIYFTCVPKEENKSLMTANNTISSYRNTDSNVTFYQVPELVIHGEKLLYRALYGNEAYGQLRKFFLH